MPLHLVASILLLASLNSFPCCCHAAELFAVTLTIANSQANQFPTPYCGAEVIRTPLRVGCVADRSVLQLTVDGGPDGAMLGFSLDGCQSVVTQPLAPCNDQIRIMKLHGAWTKRIRHDRDRIRFSIARWLTCCMYVCAACPPSARTQSASLWTASCGRPLRCPPSTFTPRPHTAPPPPPPTRSPPPSTRATTGPTAPPATSSATWASSSAAHRTRAAAATSSAADPRPATVSAHRSLAIAISCHALHGWQTAIVTHCVCAAAVLSCSHPVLDCRHRQRAHGPVRRLHGPVHPVLQRRLQPDRPRPELRRRTARGRRPCLRGSALLFNALA